MKAIIEIEASEWTQDNLDSFVDWLNDELLNGNMATGDDAHVVNAKFVTDTN
jgi:hypothetical protein